MVMGNNCKYFSGSIPYEKLAARIYDIFAFQHFGLRTKVNLDYRKQDLLHVVNEIEQQLAEQEHEDIEKSPYFVLKGTIDLQEI